MEFTMPLAVAPHGPLARRRYDRLPINVPLPPALRRPDREETITGDLVRDARLARVEAALFAADEPLNPRKLATAADLADAGEARRLIEKLKAFYDQDSTAFQ